MTDDMEPDQHQGGYGEPWVWLWPMGLRRVGKGKSKRGSRDHRPTEYTLCVPVYDSYSYRYVRLSVVRPL